MEDANQQENEIPQTVIQEIDAGDSLYEWEAWEFHPHDRSKMWYTIAGILGGFGLIYATFSQNYVFAIIILMMGIIFLINNLRHPERISVHLTNLGIVVGEEFYEYAELKDFSIIYQPPDVKVLYIDFKRNWMPLLSLPLDDADPNQVREILLNFVLEDLEREDETLTDTLRRLYKF